MRLTKQISGVSLIMAMWIVGAGNLWGTCNNNSSARTDSGHLTIGQMTSPRTTALFEKVLAAPGVAKPRLELASTYETLPGYRDSANFFRLTARYLSGRSVTPRIETDWVWPFGCDFVHLKEEPYSGGDNHSNGLSKVELELYSQGIPRPGAIDDLERLIAMSGQQCQLLAEWSGVIVVTSIFGGKGPGIGKEELAVRTLISLASKNVFPEAFMGQAPVFREVALYFETKGDYVSAYVAMLAADSALGEGGSPGSWDPAGLASTITASLSVLRVEAEKQVLSARYQTSAPQEPNPEKVEGSH